MIRSKFSRLFTRANLKGAIPAILVLLALLLVLNIALGISLTMIQAGKTSASGNEAAKFMEIDPGRPVADGGASQSVDLQTLQEAVAKIPGVSSSFLDMTFVTQFDPCHDDDDPIGFTVLGVPPELLSVFGVYSYDDKYIFMPKSDEKLFEGINKVDFQGGTLEQKGGKETPVLKDYSYMISGFYDDFDWDLFPPHLVLIDESTALENARADSPAVNGFGTSRIGATEVIAYVPDISHMQAIEEQVNAQFPNAHVAYPLKNAGGFAWLIPALIALGDIILLVSGLILCLTRSARRQPPSPA